MTASQSGSSSTLVIKVGGGKAIDVDAVIEDLATLNSRGQRFVLVHGGAQSLDEVATALGHPPEFVTSESGYSSRRTDRRTLEIFEMVYCGQLNKMWVEKLQRRNIAAIGLSGLDGRIFEGKRKDKLRIRRNGKRMVLRDDWTGTVEKVNSSLLELLLDNGYQPVITPPGSSFEGDAINVDGDRAAAAVAVALGADTFLLLSDVPGLLAEFPDESSLIPKISARNVEASMQYAEGRMKKKVMGAAEAVAQGVSRVIFADGRIEHPIEQALAGGGTHIV
jgi:acetylglutamate/LysW-gamma-L-alpha-aminoadipate kinase